MNRARHAIERPLAALAWLVALVCFGVLTVLGVGPHTGRYSTLTVLSGSMRPSIPVGAVLVDTPEPARNLRVGDVVTYAIPAEDHRVITHRVVRIISGGDHPVFQTKGDANSTADPWLGRVSGTTVWRVRAVVPGAGLAIHWLRGNTIHLLGVVILPTVVALWWVMTIWRDDDETDTNAPVGAVAS
jgi:signal peptidase